MKGQLFLLPNLLGKESDPQLWLPPIVASALIELDGLLAESEREGRRYLSYFPTKRPPRETPIAVLPNQPEQDDLAFLLEPVLDGESWGLVSDAGLPCLADPGTQVVGYAHRKGVQVVAYPGPCSITHALVCSGLTGQRFAFHGYLQRERTAQLKELEKRAERDSATQIFMEAPYRNQATLEAAVQVLNPSTRLCVGCNLTLPTELIRSQAIKIWRQKKLPDLHKQPAIFLIG